MNSAAKAAQSPETLPKITNVEGRQIQESLCNPPRADELEFASKSLNSQQNSSLEPCLTFSEGVSSQTQARLQTALEDNIKYISTVSSKIAHMMKESNIQVRFSNDIVEDLKNIGTVSNNPDIGIFGITNKQGIESALSFTFEHNGKKVIFFNNNNFPENLHTENFSRSDQQNLNKDLLPRLLTGIFESIKLDNIESGSANSIEANLGKNGAMIQILEALITDVRGGNGEERQAKATEIYNNNAETFFRDYITSLRDIVSSSAESFARQEIIKNELEVACQSPLSTCVSFSNDIPQSEQQQLQKAYDENMQYLQEVAPGLADLAKERKTTIRFTNNIQEDLLVIAQMTGDAKLAQSASFPNVKEFEYSVVNTKDNNRSIILFNLGKHTQDLSNNTSNRESEQELNITVFPKLLDSLKKVEGFKQRTILQEPPTQGILSRYFETQFNQSVDKLKLVDNILDNANGTNGSDLQRKTIEIFGTDAENKFEALLNQFKDDTKHLGESVITENEALDSLAEEGARRQEENLPLY